MPWVNVIYPIDAVAIVLFQTFSKFIGYAHSVESLMIASFDFMLIFIGSTMLGIFLGLMSALLFKHFPLRKEVTQEIGALFVFSYLPFLVAEAVEMSGIVSILFAAITIKHYTHKNISPEAQSKCIEIFKLLAYLTETAVILQVETWQVAY